MIKKRLSLLIASCLILAFALPSFAAETPVYPDNFQIDAIDDPIETPQYDIVYGGKDAKLDKKFDDIVEKVKDHKKKNPSKTDKEMDEYTNKLMKEPLNDQPNDQSIGAKYTDMDGYITGYLNPLEKQLYNSNKTKALLCMANGKLALDYSKAYYQAAVLHNGNGDAFRHCLWNFGMGIDVGVNFAKQWSDAHENGTPNNPPLEKQMDLFNNGVGLQLARDYPGTIWHSDFINKSRDKCRTGKLRIIVNNKIVVSSNVGEK